MELSHLQQGRTPFVTNVQVYAASAVDDGAMMVVGNTGSALTNIGATITVSTSSTVANSVVGITQVSSATGSASKENLGTNSHAFRIDTDGIPNRGTATGGDWLPLCISPDAVYYGRYSQTTGAGTASDNIIGFTASTGLLVTAGTVGSQAHKTGAWCYSVGTVSGGAATYSGSLRYITNSSSTVDFVILTAMNISTDSELVLTNSPLFNSVMFTSGASLLRSRCSAGAATATRNDGAQIRALDVVGQWDSSPFHRLRYHVDDGLDGLAGVQLYDELIFTDSIFA
jgi:hypothetical protein